MKENKANLVYSLCIILEKLASYIKSTFVTLVCCICFYNLHIIFIFYIMVIQDALIEAVKYCHKGL